MSRARRLFALWALLGVVGTLLWWLRTPPAAPASTPVGLLGATGTTLGDYRGRPLLLWFWSPGCPACIEDLPRLDALRPELERRGIPLILVALPDTAAEAVRPFAADRPVALDPEGRLNRAVGIVHLAPTLLVLDPQGRVAARLHGRLAPPRLFATLDSITP